MLKRQIYTKQCLNCKDYFKTYHKKKQTCSIKCKQEYAYNLYKYKQLTGKNLLLSAELRFKILVRDKFTCQYCGRKVQDKVVLEVDHKIPKSKGGKDTEENLITSCSECNIGKGSLVI